MVAKMLIAGVLSALLLTNTQTPAQINNSTIVEAQAETVQAAEIETAARVETQAPTEQKTIVEPENKTPDPEAEAKAFIYFKESGNRTDAINPSSGACGIGQALPCSKMPCTLQDYECQDRYFTSYMQQRYGTWQNAKAFWLSRKPINGKDMGNWW